MKFSSCILRSGLACSTLVLGTMAAAQLPLVDVTWSVLPTQQVEVRMRPDGPFSSLFSSEVFTVRWLDTGEQGLGAISQDPEYFVCVPVSKSGPEQVSGIYRYQIFQGSSLTTFADAELNWEADQEYVIARIAILNGSGFFEIVNDEWTGEITNNGDYYVSLEGQDRTGEIYNLFTEVDHLDQVGIDVDLMPNPATTMTTLRTELAVPIKGAELQILDATGRVIWSVHRDLPAGAYQEVIDLMGASSGAYLLRVQHATGVIARQLIITDRRY